MMVQKPKVKQRRKSTPIPDYITSFTKNNVTTYQCNICRKRFKTKAHIYYHLVCKTGMKPLTCDLCGKGFISKNHLDYHLRQHNGERPYKCEICGMGFAQQGHATRHIKKTHAGVDPIKGTVSNKELQEVKRTLVAPKFHEYRQFTGKICEKEFYLQEKLKRHSRCISTERSFPCDECPMAFHTKRDCERQRLIHKNAQKIECPICNRGIGRKDNFKRHLRRHLEKGETVAETLGIQIPAPPKFHYSKNTSTDIEGTVRHNDFNANAIPFMKKNTQVRQSQYTQTHDSDAQIRESEREESTQFSGLETNANLHLTLRGFPNFVPVPFFVLFPYVISDYY
ncbi:unnamed protein product [Orchesella dallaii]|uniref:C2H2-type domain-containing protein n=1 Tax=Orchesella dallaii TaxID=48710 RepID=A0ABP1S1M9_9HEXA